MTRPGLEPAPPASEANALNIKLSGLVIQNTISSSFKDMTFKETAYKETTIYDIVYMTYIMFSS